MSMIGEEVTPLSTTESMAFAGLTEAYDTEPTGICDEAAVAGGGLTSVMERARAAAEGQKAQTEAGISDLNASATAFQSSMN